jgi:hypothetical protein
LLPSGETCVSEDTVRREILQSLLLLDRSLRDVLQLLSAFPWDSEMELVRLRPEHIIKVLHRFKAGELTARDVEDWANAIEGRDDIGLGDSMALRDVLFDLANPVLEGAMEGSSIDAWITKLDQMR